jgi:integrase
VLENEKSTFQELADFYEETYLIAPQYVGDRKVAGLRSAYDYKHRLKVLRDHFGKKKLRSITHGDLERYKSIRLKTPAIVGRNTRGKRKKDAQKSRQRSIATVHRELSLLRRVFNVAVRNGWMIRNPFEMGDPLIKPGDEKPRERILTREEEERLLVACTGPRSHLRPIIICALDTGMRQGEIFKLQWRDVDLDSGLITVRAFNTKTMRERQVAMTPRLTRELLNLFEQSLPEPKSLVFGITGTVKTSFDKARKAAGIPDVRFHDLRHTAASRLVQSHIPLSEVGRVLGHTQPQTTYRYVNANVDTARRAAEALAAFGQGEGNNGESHLIQ